MSKRFWGSIDDTDIRKWRISILPNRYCFIRNWLWPAEHSWYLYECFILYGMDSRANRRINKIFLRMINKNIDLDLFAQRIVQYFSCTLIHVIILGQINEEDNEDSLKNTKESFSVHSRECFFFQSHSFNTFASLNRFIY